jgi:RNAse (barnase) inhibitor barstar
MKIILDLTDVNDKNTLFAKLDEELIIEHWGHNWDALNDCLRDLDSGGFTKKYPSPLDIEIINSKEFKSKNPNDFKIFKDIFEHQSQEHARYGFDLKVNFVS